MKNKDKLSKEELRLKAEEKLNERRKRLASPADGEIDSLRLFHELEVLQIELEMQNEELMQSQQEAITALDKYTDLYDFAPVGYFTLTRDSTIIQVNINGSKLLDVERSQLIERRLGLFIAHEFRPKFNAFLEEAFVGGRKETCEVVLQKNDREIVWVQMEGSRDEQGENCRIAATDITKRKIVEEERGKLAAIVESSDDAIVGKTLDGVITSWNLGAQRLYGYSTEEAIGQSVSILAPLDRQNEVVEILSRLKRGEVIDHFETVRQRKDGVKLNVSISVSPVMDAAGRVVAASSISRDITGRKRVEDELRKLARAVEQSPVTIVITDIAGNIEYVNPKFTETTGYTMAEAVHRNPRILKSGYTTEQEYKELWDTIISGGEWHGEFHNRKKNGDMYWEVAKIAPIWNDRGEITHFVAVKEDITEHKKMEETLKGSQMLYRLLAENSSDSVSLIDVDGEVQYVSPSYVRRLGYDENEMLSLDIKGILERLHPDDRERIAAEIKRGRELKLVTSRYEYRARTKSGDYIWMEDVLRREFDEHGQFLRTIINSRDIAERKQAEEDIRQLNAGLEKRVEDRTSELIYANRAKDDFLANMSHELRTPLNGILGFSETLMDGTYGTVTERQRRALELINSSGQHLLALINDILDVSKIESGKFDLQPEVVIVNEVCEASLVFIRQLAFKKSITVEYSRSSFALTVNADPRRLKQILVNLLNNSVKFTPENGKIKLQVEANVKSGQLQFSVIDTGIGISPVDLDKLFTPFVQVESSLSRRYEGTGLGLALVKQLVEMHGGHVEVQSEPGHGSCFSFMLPWDQTMQVNDNRNIFNAIPAKQEMAINGMSITHRRVLLAEDHKTNAMVTRDFLESRGYQVFLVQDGDEVFSKAEEVSPDIILMDIQMPHLNGYDAARLLRADPRFATVPIIALTAFAMPGDRERCLEAGMNDYLSKPVRLVTMIQTIEQLLKVTVE